MPSNLSLYFTTGAREDFAAILHDTLLRWGEEQRVAYEAAITGALQRLVDFPEIGKARNDLFPGCRICRVRQHVVVYAIEDLTITIVRILHVRMDLKSQFEG